MLVPRLLKDLEAIMHGVKQQKNLRTHGAPISIVEVLC